MRMSMKNKLVCLISYGPQRRPLGKYLDMAYKFHLSQAYCHIILHQIHL